MTTSVSTLGLQLLSTSGLQDELAKLNLLNTQLATGQQHSNLTDYSPVSAQQLLSFQNAITQRQSYIDSMKTVNARLLVYDTTMNDLEKIAAQANSLATQNPTLNPNQVGGIQQQALSYIQQAVDDLNQKVGSRYVYAGTRYSTQPVSLSQVLANLSPSATLAAQGNTSPDNLPSYDTDYGTGSLTTVNQAWTKDSAIIDTGYTLQYGVTSTQDGFQQLIAGLQFINAATQTGVDAATYQSDMQQASQLLSAGLTNIQTYHTGVAAATNTITQAQSTQNTDITNLQSQIGDIQNVDVAQVGTEINTLQAQLQASYSVTATLVQNSILKYL